MTLIKAINEANRQMLTSPSQGFLTVIEKGLSVISESDHIMNNRPMPIRLSVIRIKGFIGTVKRG
jgi:hypothetical protein